MINKDRIVPIEKTDLITMYGLLLKLSNISSISGLTKLAPKAISEFAVPDGTKYLLTEPVKSCDLTEVGNGNTFDVYFVPAYDFDGFYFNGAKVTLTGTVEADGVSLYNVSGTIGSTVTVTKLGL